VADCGVGHWLETKQQWPVPPLDFETWRALGRGRDGSRRWPGEAKTRTEALVDDLFRQMGPAASLTHDGRSALLRWWGECRDVMRGEPASGVLQPPPLRSYQHSPRHLRLNNRLQSEGLSGFSARQRVRYSSDSAASAARSTPGSAVKMSRASRQSGLADQ